MEDLVTVEEACEILKLTRSALYKRISAGKLNTFKRGDGWRTWLKRDEVVALANKVTPIERKSR